mmetsp:Transcript_1847/g.3582  ORF Transcript_1847/g.3582 Transcript_1847/m.3582 type:complete len:1011 (-) Transcript_1847:204-3236(-)
MVCEVDSEGRCKRHPFVQIQRRGRSGEWKALLDACPLCIIDDNKSVGSGGSRSKGSSAAGNGGIENLSVDHGAMVPLSRENSNQWGLDNVPLEATPSHSSRVTVKFATEDAGDNGNPDGVSTDPSSPDFYGNQPLRLPVHHDNHRRSYYQEDDDSQSNNPHGNDPHFSSGVSLASSTATGRYSTTGASIVSSSSNANNSVYSSKSSRSAPGLQTQMRASALKSLPKYRACPQKMQQYAHVSGSVTTMSMDLDIEDDDDSTEEGGGQDNRTMNSDASGSNSNSNNSNSNNSNSNSKSRELKGRDSKEGNDRSLQRKSSGDRQQQKPSRRDRHGNGGKVQNHPSRPDPEEYLGHDHQQSNHHFSRHNDSNGSNNYFQPPPPPASGPGQRFTIVSPSSRVDDDEVSAISFQSGLSQLQTNPMSHGGYGNNNTPNNSGNGGGHNDMHRPLPGGYSSHHNNNHHHSYGGRMNGALHNELNNFEMVPENDTLLSPAQPNHPPAASTLPFPIRDNRHGNNNNYNNHHGKNNYNFQDPQDEEDLTSTLPAINTNNYDSKGRCIAHPHIRLRKKKLLGRGWKVLMNACPDCCVEELRRIKLVESARRRKDRAELRQSLQAAASAQAMMAAASAGQGGLHHGYGNPQGLSSSMNAGPVGSNNGGGGNGFGALASDSDDRNRHNNHPLRNSIQSGPVGGGMGRASTGVGTRRQSNNSSNSKNTNGSSPAVAPPPTKSTSFHSATPAKSTSFHSVSNSNTSNNTPTSRGLPPPPPPPPPPQKQSNHKSSDETASLTNSSSGSSRDHNLSFASIHSNPAKQGISSSQDTNNNNNNITIKPSASGANVPKSSSNKDVVNNYGSSTGISNGIQVKSMQWTDDKGNKGVYTGPVNSHFIPHGKGGKMEYDGGKVKEGEWKNGSLRRSSSHHRHHHHHRSSSTAPSDAGGNASGKSSSRRDKETTASSSSSSNKHGDERRSERKSSERRSTSAMRSSSRLKERGDGNFRSSGVGKSTSFVRSDKGSQ